MCIRDRRRSAHGSQITGGNGQRTLTEKKGIAGFGEMHPGDQGVGGNRQLFTGGQRQHRAVITNTENHSVATLSTTGGGEVATDQLELIHGQATICCASALLR